MMDESATGEMKSWENFALKRLGKVGGREFEPRHIPLMQAARIRVELKSAATPADVRRIFERELGGDDELRRANNLLERVLERLT